jgi:vanillate monooxygenase ferredoxin subunit
VLNVKIEAKRDAAEDICTFELVDPAGHALPPFTAGAHIDVHTPGGFVRQYSLCNSPSETHRYIIGVLKDPASRGGSKAMHLLEEGETIKISEPRNHFRLADQVPHSVLIAGGIGITPLLSMAEALLAANASFELHYCARSRAKMAFAERLLEERFHGLVHFHVDAEAETKFHAADVFERVSDRASHIYVCGPGGFIDYVLAAARNQQFLDTCVHREYFGATAADVGEDKPFDVQIASTGQTIRVNADESVVAALARHGIEIPVSCEQGVCGTCLTRIQGGAPLHRDLFLTDEEKAAHDQFTPCCSRARTPLLVLDL